MMGMQTAPAQFFYDFCLDDHIPDDHLLRRIDQSLDLARVRTELLPFYSTIGRPLIDPELMMRMLIVGYCMGIRSERRLCEEFTSIWPIAGSAVWGLTARCPITPRFSRNRHGRFRKSDILRHLFETIVERCMQEGLVGGEGFAVDASLIAADPNKQRSVPGDQWRTGGFDADAGRAIREYLATLDDAAFGAASEVKPKFVSPADPAAQWTGAHKGHAFVAYAANYLSAVYTELKNVFVWVKANCGMGSFYRSRHELVFVFKKGKGKQRNNIELGKNGRNRTNIWEYAGANGFGGRKSDEGELLAIHPTVKPVQMIADALLDSSACGAIVLDIFHGSGSTLIAAERTGRRLCGIEIDPIYVDVASQARNADAGDCSRRPRPRSWRGHGQGRRIGFR
jgi:transposase